MLVARGWKAAEYRGFLHTDLVVIYHLFPAFRPIFVFACNEII
jgi:hypothetical protein